MGSNEKIVVRIKCEVQKKADFTSRDLKLTRSTRIVRGMGYRNWPYDMNVMLIGKMMMDMMDHRNLGYPISTTTHVWSQWRTEPKSPDVNSGSPVDKRLCEKIVRTHQQKMVPQK